MRRINFVPQTEFPYRPYGSRSVIYDSGNYQGCLDKALAAFDYASGRAEQQRLRAAGRSRGIGVAAYTEMCGMAPSRRLATIGFDRGGWESARIAIDASGRATLYSGSMSQGHGHATVLARIAADALQCRSRISTLCRATRSRSRPATERSIRVRGDKDCSANDGDRHSRHCV